MANKNTWFVIMRQCKPIHDKEEKQYEKGCLNKKQIETNEEALRIVDIMQRVHRKAFNRYKCKFCGHFHIGSKS